MLSIFNEQYQSHMYSLPYESLVVPQSNYKFNSCTISDVDFDSFRKHLKPSESFVLLYDSGYMHFGNSGFGLSQNFFYDFKGKKAIPLSEVKSFSADINSCSLIANCNSSGSIMIPYKFSKMGGKDWWAKAANDTAKVLDMCLQHYHSIQK